MHLIDAAGQAHSRIPAGSVPRIVSLVPSLTELLCNLGLAPWLVGRTGFCIHPRTSVAAIPKVGGTKDVKIETVRALAPSHVIVNMDENDRATVEALAQFIPHVVVTHPTTVRDNLALYQLLGGIFNAEENAAALCAEFETEYAALATLPKGEVQRVLYCIWKDPWMTVSRQTYIADMLSLMNWQAWSPPENQERYPRFRWSEAVVQSVDRILLATEPYRFTEDHADMLERQLGKPVQLVDGAMLCWYGSRAIAGLRYLRLTLLSD